MDVLEVLKLLVDTLEKAEKVIPFAAIPDDYRLDALEQGKELIQVFEKANGKRG